MALNKTYAYYVENDCLALVEDNGNGYWETISTSGKKYVKNMVYLIQLDCTVGGYT